MKSFCDFIGRTEATRGARRWSWTKEKRMRLGQPRQALTIMCSNYPYKQKEQPKV
ncbi:hypothetical protein G3A_09675 [Bacillus sp. 17376]|uniref:hypothetical protein n=1 Tax=Mesobacillus boroniphilus TaxID=308892 RepID=UPI0003C7A695|nr:hypothetical protein [Mesobacillus boroniphilus]ESU32773.1 hypothetical protein G3A_09675 [Bacillus sp. 17376]